MFKNKKLLIAFSLLFIALFAVACGGGDDDSGSSDNGSDSEETAQNGDAENGEGIFESNCMSCHGADGKGDSGPDLTSESDYDAVVDQVKNGGGAMPAFADQLSEQEINDVAAFITEKVAD